MLLRLWTASLIAMALCFFRSGALHAEVTYSFNGQVSGAGPTTPVIFFIQVRHISQVSSTCQPVQI